MDMRNMQSLLPWRSFHVKDNPSLLRSRAWAFLLTAAAILTLLLSTASSSFAGSATWLASPANGDWNNAANWTAGGPPNGTSDTATFHVSTITDIFLSDDTDVDGIVFDAGASAFTITVDAAGLPATPFQIFGVGITNNSGIMQNFVPACTNCGSIPIAFFNSATAGSLTAFTTMGGGDVDFLGTSTAGSATFIINGGTIGGGAETTFSTSSSADNGTFINNGGAVSGLGGGSTIFFGTSTAGNATVIANGGVDGGEGGSIQFFTDSTGGTARMEVFDNGNLEIDFHNPPGVTIGSIEGSGLVFLGAIT